MRHLKLFKTHILENHALISFFSNKINVLFNSVFCKLLGIRFFPVFYSVLPFRVPSLSSWWTFTLEKGQGCWGGGGEQPPFRDPLEVAHLRAACTASDLHLSRKGGRELWEGLWVSLMREAR